MSRNDSEIFKSTLRRFCKVGEKMTDFVEQYISKCIENGISKPSEIIKTALERRNQIDSEIEKIYELREEADNLTKVLKEIVDKTGYDLEISSTEETFQEVSLEGRKIIIKAGVNK